MPQPSLSALHARRHAWAVGALLTLAAWVVHPLTHVGDLWTVSPAHSEVTPRAADAPDSDRSDAETVHAEACALCQAQKRVISSAADTAAVSLAPEYSKPAPLTDEPPLSRAPLLAGPQAPRAPPRA